MWFRVRQGLYALVLGLIALVAWNYPWSDSSIMERIDFRTDNKLYLESRDRKLVAGPSVKVGVPPSSDSWWEEILAAEKAKTRAERDASVRKLSERKAKLEREKADAAKKDKENAERQAAEKKQKEEADERERKITFLQVQIEQLQKPDYAGLGSNAISALCALGGLWFAYLTWRGPKKDKPSGPPALPT